MEDALEQGVAGRFDPAAGLDVVALGALNVDLIAKPRPGEDDQPVEDGEVLTSSREILQRIRADDLDVMAYHGGSAYNALVMVAQLRTELRLAMIGVSAAPAYGLHRSHAARLRDLHILDLTKQSRHRPGLCCALPSAHGRKLWTAPEANLEITDHLQGHDRLRAAVGQARVLHVTSLLERPSQPDSSEVVDAVARFVETAKADNPSLIFSFDPGDLWVKDIHRQGLRRIYQLADVVYANVQEYAALTSGGDTSSSVRMRSLRHLCPASTLVILKAHRELIVQHASGFDLARIPQREHVVAVDPTGAGDAVAAGVLAALGQGRDLVEGCALGLRLAARRVAAYGDSGHSQLRDSLGTLWPEDELAAPASGVSVPSAGDVVSPQVEVNVNVHSSLQMAAVADDLAQMMDRLRVEGDDVDRDLWLALNEAKQAAEDNDEPRLVSWLHRLGRRGAELAAKVSATVVERVILRQLGL